MREATTYREIRCQLTSDEIIAAARRFVGTRKSLLQTLKDKAQAMKKYKEDLETLEKEITRLSQIVENGYEYREFHCRIGYDDPRPGTKSFYNLTSGELLDTAEMSEFDRQEEFPLENRTPAPGPAPEGDGEEGQDLEDDRESPERDEEPEATATLFDTQEAPREGARP